MKLSLAMICKDELKNLKELYPLVKDHIDEWIVVVPPKDKAIPFLKKVGAKVIIKDHTQAIESKLRKEMQEWGVEVAADYRLFNFAAARNTSFAAATGDWIMWLDADDRPVGLEKVKPMLVETKTDILDVVYDYARDAEDNSVSDHIRERIIRNNGKFEWKGAKLGLIHETLVPKGASYTPLTYKIDKGDFYIQHVSDHADQSSIRNHIALLYEYLKTNGEDARTTYYLGVEFFNRKMYPECIAIMHEYVKVGGWDEERFRAWIRMAEAYHQLGDKKSSRNAYLNAQLEMPDYPESYLGLGESYYSEGNWGKAIEYMVTGLEKPIPKTKSAIDMVKYTFRPSVFIALSHLQSGRPDEAYRWFQRAIKLNPKHPWVNKYRELFEEAKDLNDYVRSFVKLGQISKRLYPKTLGKLAAAIPDELQDQEVLLDFKRRFSIPKIWPDKSIVYFCSQAFEDWGPDSLKTGTGGSEEAVINLTKHWVKLGYDVTVFNNCPEEKVVDGVKWVRWEKFNPRDIFDILITWRNNPFLEPKVARKKFIDVHDVPSLRYFPEESLKDVKLMVKSQYHRGLFPELADHNFKIVHNGIDSEQFEAWPAEKVKNKMVWTSSLDRGLEYLLEMWPEIKAAVPDATLDVYYGFNLFDVSARAKTEEGQRWRAKMVRLLDQEGVNFIGRVGSDEIAKAYLEADVFAYPTDFPEIDCISMTKAMVAGCVPIATDYAALSERNQGVVIQGNGADPKVQQEFKEKLIQLLQDEKLKEEIRQKIDVSGYSWKEIAKRWTELF